MTHNRVINTQKKERKEKSTTHFEKELRIKTSFGNDEQSVQPSEYQY